MDGGALARRLHGVLYAWPLLRGIWGLALHLVREPSRPRCRMPAGWDNVASSIRLRDAGTYC